jgi:thiol-disulfide isomerase/thioredoxin
MRKIVIFFIILLVVIFGCSSEKTIILRGSVKLAGSEQKSGIEIRAYYVTRKVTENDLLAQTTTGKQGNFTLRLPESCSSFELHISYPNYEFYKTKFINADIEPFLEVTLQPASISENVSEVKVVGDFCDFNWERSIPMIKNENGLYEIEIEYNKPEMAYQFLFDTERHSYSNPIENSKYEYDHGGDYKNMVQSDNGKYKITVDLSNFPRYTKKGEVPKSKGQFISAPNNEFYAIISEKIKEYELPRITSIFMFKDREHPYHKEFFKGMQEHEIQEMVSDSEMKLNEVSAYVDSLIIVSEHQFLKDYLLGVKLYIQMIYDECSFEEQWLIFESIKDISAAYPVSYLFIWKKEFQENDIKFINIIHNKILEVKNERKQNELLYKFYYTLSNNNIDGKYSQLILKEAEKILASENYPENRKANIKKLISKIKLSDTEFAPDFEFVDFDGKSHKLSDFRGKWILIDFWAIWCGPCITEIPHLIEAHQYLDKNNFVIISISGDKRIETAKEFVKENNMDWIHTIDIEGYVKDVGIQYGVSSIPKAFLIDPEGRFVRSEKLVLRGESLLETLKKYIK